VLTKSSNPDVRAGYLSVLDFFNERLNALPAALLSMARTLNDHFGYSFFDTEKDSGKLLYPITSSYVQSGWPTNAASLQISSENVPYVYGEYRGYIAVVCGQCFYRNDDTVLPKFIPINDAMNDLYSRSKDKKITVISSLPKYFARKSKKVVDS